MSFGVFLLRYADHFRSMSGLAEDIASASMWESFVLLDSVDKWALLVHHYV